MAVWISVAAIIIFLAVGLNKVFSKIGVPMLLAFIVLGLIFGADGIFRIKFDNYVISEQICSIALIFIMFYGGFGTKWSEARPVAKKAAVLSTLGVFLTAFFVGIFCYFVLRISFLESFLIGAVISSTDAASVFSILRSKKLGLKYHTASMLELESGSNDPCSYMLTIIVLSAMGGEASIGGIVVILLKQFGIGIIAGVIIAWVAHGILKRAHFNTAGFNMAFVIGVALLAYALPTVFGGNGYLSVYIVGIVLGNGKIKDKQSLVHFFDGITGLMQILIFFLLGLLANPSDMLPIMGTAILIALFLTLVSRPLSVFLILTPAKSSVPQQLLVSFAGLRGAASIVFAIVATVNKAYMQQDVFHIVFCIVLLSILVQGSLIPVVAKKLSMIDKNEDIRKTFNDYSEDPKVQYIKSEIHKGHPWANRTIEELQVPSDMLIVIILRADDTIIPNGKTQIQEGDLVIVSATTFLENTEVCLKEYEITKNSKWRDKTIVEFSTNPQELVVMIKRGEHIILPRGDTRIEYRDTLVLTTAHMIQKGIEEQS